MSHVIKSSCCYWYPEDKDVQLTKNFKVGEFHSRSNHVILIEPELIKTLQTIRDVIDAPININSGFRAQSHNTNCGGSYNSAHLWGCAADIWTPKMKSPDLAHIIWETFKEQLAIGLHTPENYVHIDTLYRGNWYKETVSNKVKSF